MDLAIGISASLIASALLYLKILRPFMRRVTDEINVLVNPVEEFRDVGQLCRLLNQAIDSYAGDLRRLVLLRLLPCELSESLVDYMYGTEEARLDSRNPLTKYHELLNRTIKQGHGSFDVSVFGRTNISKIDSATLNEIKKHYFLNERPPDTSELAFHKNLNEIGLVLLGDAEDVLCSDVVQWRAGFLIVFSSDFKKVRGFMYRVHSHIDNLRLIFNQKKNDSKDQGLLCQMSSKMEQKILEDFLANAESFFAS